MFILKCEAFDGEPGILHPNRCCDGDCHKENRLIPVTPYALDATLENRRLDWELGIQAMVCCGRYEFVRALSREWWVRKGEEVGLWDGVKAVQLMHKGSWHPTYDRRVQSDNSSTVGVSKSASGKRGRTTISSCPSCGSSPFAEVCDNCGYGFSI